MGVVFSINCYSLIQSCTLNCFRLFHASSLIYWAFAVRFDYLVSPVMVVGAGIRNPLEDPYDVMNASAENTGYVNITTPPRVLTVDERFPQLEEEEDPSSSQPPTHADIVSQW